MSNLILIACLLLGFAAGLINKKEGQSKTHSRLLFASILILIFCMGAILGFDPELPTKIMAYGVSALVITGFSLFFGVIAVWIVVKLTGLKS